MTLTIFKVLGNNYIKRVFVSKVLLVNVCVCVRGVHISMGKFQSGFLKKHIIFPGCICFSDYKNIRVEFF